MKEVTTTQGQAVATGENKAWGAEGAMQRHVIIPKLQIMNQLSELVKARKANAGDILDSVSGDKLADEKTGIEVIPFKVFSTIQIFEGHGGKKKWKKTVPYSEELADLPFEDYDENKAPITRQHVLNFFAMLTGKLDEFPYLVSFKSSSFQTGRKLSSHFTMCEMKKIPPASAVFTLTSFEKKKDNNTWYAFDVKKSRSSTKEELAAARHWYDVLSKSEVAVKVDDSDEDKSIVSTNDNDETPF